MMKMVNWVIFGLLLAGPGLSHAVDIQVGSSGTTLVSQVQSASDPLPVRVSLYAMTEKPAVGDLVKLMVKIIFQPGVNLKAPQYPDKLGEWDVMTRELGKVQTVEDHLVRLDTLTLQTFSPGEVEVPAVIQQFQNAAGQLAEFRSLPITIKVNPLPMKKSDRSGQFRGLKPQIWLISWWWVLGIAVLLLLLAASAAYIVYRKRAAIKAFLTPPPPPRPPEEIALERLAKLEKADYLVRVEYKLFYIELSDILRRYLEGQFQIPVIDRTTPELMREMKNSSVKRAEIMRIREFLENSDMVKFAKFMPLAKDASNDLELVRRLVLQLNQEVKAGLAGSSQGEKKP